MRTLSTDFLRASIAQETGDGPIVLLTIDHASLSEPIRVSSDATERIEETEQQVVYGTTSRGDSFSYYPFEMVLPSDEEEGVPSTSLSIDNADAQITDAVRELTSPATVGIEVILRKHPDRVELSFPMMHLLDAEWDRAQVTGNISMDVLLSEKMGSAYRIISHPGVHP